MFCPPLYILFHCNCIFNSAWKAFVKRVYFLSIILQTQKLNQNGNHHTLSLKTTPRWTPLLNPLDLASYPHCNTTPTFRTLRRLYRFLKFNETKKMLTACDLHCVAAIPLAFGNLDEVNLDYI